jgi:hypothetical protein
MRYRSYVGLLVAYMDLEALRDDAMSLLKVEKQQWIGGSRITMKDLRILYRRRDNRRARVRYWV